MVCHWSVNFLIILPSGNHYWTTAVQCAIAGSHMIMILLTSSLGDALPTGASSKTIDPLHEHKKTRKTPYIVLQRPPCWSTKVYVRLH